MSQFVNRERCLLCRSKKNYDSIRNTVPFNVTLSIQMMYLLVMYPIEKCDSIHAKGSSLANVIRKYCYIDDFNNNFENGDIIRFFRNSLAHFNYQESSIINGEIDEILFYALSDTKALKPKCNEVCETPKCVPTTVYNTSDKEHIIDYKIKTTDLEAFIEELSQLALDQNAVRSKGNKCDCSKCSYNTEDLYSIKKQ